MPVKIDNLEEMSEEEFNSLRRERTRRALDPGMEELLTRLAAGQTVRVPIGPDQTARGLRVSIGRLAAQRGMRVEAVEGEGFLGVRRIEEPESRSSRKPSAGDGRRRGRRRRTDQAGAEAEGVSPVPVSVPRISTTGDDPRVDSLPEGPEVR